MVSSSGFQVNLNNVTNLYVYGDGNSSATGQRRQWRFE